MRGSGKIGICRHDCRKRPSPRSRTSVERIVCVVTMPERLQDSARHGVLAELHAEATLGVDVALARTRRARWFPCRAAARTQSRPRVVFLRGNFMPI